MPQPVRKIDVSVEITMIIAKTGEEVRRKLEDYEKRGGGQFDGVKLAGTVEECAEQLRKYRDAGVGHFILSLPGGRNPETLTLISEELLPMVKPV
jgi:alkanesulfonate monooxygenase SsuD/methylene tetrahydromethanopterin reductase-like flavin-dependent oxidoreductase (luciferase family)